MGYAAGDVAVVYYPHDDGNTGKPRPVVILGMKGNKYVVCQVTKTIPGPKMLHKFVGLSTSEGKTMGIDVDSYVMYDRIKIIPEKFIQMPIGTCPFYKEIIDNYLELNGSSAID